jgi:hypothetical protein
MRRVHLRNLDATLGQCALHSELLNSSVDADTGSQRDGHTERVLHPIGELHSYKWQSSYSRTVT